MTTSPHIVQRERRKLESAAAAFRANAEMERVLEWARTGDPRYDALDPQTKTSAGYYQRAKAAHREITREGTS